MCGIIAYTGKQQAVPVLIDGLRRLEYRGYDSAGISVCSRRRLSTWKSAGKITALESQLPYSIKANSGIGHTRWATHGAPTDENAHPHTDVDESITVVHNGIIENVETLKANLEVEYRSETDSEVLAHLLSGCIKKKSMLID